MTWTPTPPGSIPTPDEILAHLDPIPGEVAGYISPSDIYSAWDAFLSMFAAFENWNTNHLADADAHPQYQAVSEKGEPDGYPSLGSDGIVPADQLPPGVAPGAASSITVSAAGFDGILSPADDTVQKALQTIDDLLLGGGAVDSVNGQTGVVVLDASDVGADPAGTAAALVDDLSGLSNASAGRTALGLGDAATRDVGAGAGDVAAGDDPRLSDTRDPNAHAHAPTDVTGTAVIDSDPRLTDARTPTAHAASHGSAGSDPVALAQTQVSGLTSDLAAKVDDSEKGAAGGVATLDGSGLIPSSQLPPIAITKPNVVVSQVAMLALTAEEGDVAIRTDLNKSFILKSGGVASVLADWLELLTPTDTVLSVNGETGAVTLSAADVGAVDTADAGKTTAGAGTQFRFIGLYAAAGALTSGTYVLNDVAFNTTTGSWWRCTVAGTPGTWVEITARLSDTAPANVTADTAAAGTATEASRRDHKHDIGTAGFATIVPVAFGDTAAAGSSTALARGDHRHAAPADPTGKPLALTGATAATRYVGGTASGAPASGTGAVGDFVIDQTAKVWVCTVAGSPGTWAQAGSVPDYVAYQAVNPMNRVR